MAVTVFCALSNLWWFLIPVGIGALLIWLVVWLGRDYKKVGGRTSREFAPLDHVWYALDMWADLRKYKLVAQEEDLRRYRKRVRDYWTLIGATNLEVCRTTSGYRLDAWLSIRKIWRIIPSIFWLTPKEMAIDNRRDWRFAPDVLDIARADVNFLIGMLHADIEPIP